jgi:xanthine dehydrogenase YagT iron-sulfur-binding subunit
LDPSFANWRAHCTLPDAVHDFSEKVPPMTLPPCWLPPEEEDQFASQPETASALLPPFDPESPPDPTRRSFLLGTAVAAAGAVVAPLLAREKVAGATVEVAAHAMPLALDINGRVHELLLDPRTTLLDALRERLDLTGTKKGCDQGACGACTVLIDGRRVNSCLTLAVMHSGQKIVTIEGLARDGRLHPVQAAFIRNDGFQCGYCTPGQICSAVGLLHEGHTSSDDEIREWMSGNICRCGAYVNIVAAIREAEQNGGRDATV